MSATVTEAEFDEVVGSAQLPVVLEFYATWCGNCRRIAAELEALAGEFERRVRFVRVNADEAAKLVSRFGVTSTPTLFVLAGGQQMASVVGAQPAPVLRGLFETAAQPGTAARSNRETPAPACECGPACATPAATTSTGSDLGWAPVQACTLPTAERPMRMAQFESLFSGSLIAQRRQSARWLRLRLSGGADVEAAARQLTAREAQCCSFFDFGVQREGAHVVLDVRVPQDKVMVLDGMAAQAEAARAARA